MMVVAGRVYASPALLLRRLWRCAR